MKFWYRLIISMILASLFIGMPFLSTQLLVKADMIAGSPLGNQGALSNACIWLCPDQIDAIPSQGKAWANLVEWADSDESPKLSGKTNDGDIVALANAILYVQTGDNGRRNKVIDYLNRAIGTEGKNALPLSRNLPGYLIAADLVGYHEPHYKEWAANILDKKIGGNGGDSILEKALNRPNNHGTMALAAWASIAVYTGNQRDLDQVARVFKGWMGDRSAYSDFNYGKLKWQDDPENPVGINCAGCPRDGAQPEEMRRGKSAEQYSWEALQGAFLTAEILYLQGYDVYNWVDQALLRAVRWNYSQGWPIEGDDEWLAWIINARYGTDYSAPVAARTGKNFGFTDLFYVDAPQPNQALLASKSALASTPKPSAPTATPTFVPTPTSKPPTPTAVPTEPPVSRNIVQRIIGFLWDGN